MRIEIGKDINDVQIYGKSGTNITKELCITEVEVKIKAGEPHKAILTCEVWDGFTAEIDFDNVAALVEHRNLKEHE